MDGDRLQLIVEPPRNWSGDAEFEKILAPVVAEFLRRDDISPERRAALEEYMRALPPKLRPLPAALTGPAYNGVAKATAYGILADAYVEALEVPDLPPMEAARLMRCRGHCLDIAGRDDGAHLKVCE